MDSDLLELARTVDLTVLGGRVRAARLARGLTQTAVAGAEMSTAYVSRIEAGQRRPDPALLEVIAARVGAGVDELVVGATRDAVAELRLELDWAELSLRTGDAAGALAKLDSLLPTMAGSAHDAMRRTALRLRAGALEATGDLDSAIIALEDLTGGLPEGLPGGLPDQAGGLEWLVAVTALARCYRVSGDFDRSMETGERARTQIGRLGLTGCDDATKLLLSLSASYFERGDTGHAVRVCRRAMEEAEQSGSIAAQGSAYWNASIMESRRGHADAAVKLARKALFLIEMGDDHRQVASLRSQLGVMQLRSDSADAADALQTLKLAQSELETSDASPNFLAANRVAQARAHFILGDLAWAEHGAHEVVESTNGSLPAVAADAYVLAGQVAAARHDHDTARRHYQSAVSCLSAAGADRTAGQLWFELGSLMESVGDEAAALQAFRSAASCAGLSAINTTSRSLTIADV